MWVKSLYFVLVFLNTFLLSFCSVIIPFLSLGLVLNSPICGYWSNLRSKAQIGWLGDLYRIESTARDCETQVKSLGWVVPDAGLTCTALKASELIVQHL